MTAVDLGMKAVALSLALTATAARAQTDASSPMATSSAAAPPPAAAAPEPLPTTATAPLDGPDEAPVRDGKIHGMVGASIGSDGSHSGMVAVDAPLPGGGDLQIAVSSSQGGRYGHGGRARPAPREPAAN